MENEKGSLFRKGTKVVLTVEDGLTVSSTRTLKSGLFIPEDTQGVVVEVLDQGTVLHVAFAVERTSNNVPENISILVLREQVAHA